jgi:hypothetical protein
LKVSIGWRVQQWAVVPDGAIKERKKRVEEMEWQKKRRSSREQGKMTLDSAQFLGVSLRRIVTTYCFPGCKSGKLRVGLHTLSTFLHQC